MAFKTTYSQYDNKTGLFSTEGALDLTTLPSNENKIKASDAAINDNLGAWPSTVAIGENRIVVGSPYDDDNGSASGSAYIFDLDGTQIAKITASDGAADDDFGQSVAIGSGRIVVGSPQDDDNGSTSGSAYIFDLDGTQLAKITASDGAANDNFGESVAIGSGRIVVGAWGDAHSGFNGAGSAYIFDLDGTQIAKITASDAISGELFGSSVAIGSGRIVVGAPRSPYDLVNSGGVDAGSAYIFDLDGNELTKVSISNTIYKNDEIGYSVAVGNGRIVVGAIGDDTKGASSGAAYIFDLDGTQIAKITASDGATDDRFGYSVAVGNGRIAVGTLFKESVYIFDLDGTQLTKMTPSDVGAGGFQPGGYYGRSVAVGCGKIAISAPFDDDPTDSGAIYTYDISNVKDIFSIVD